MLPPSGRTALVALVVALALSGAACGKKAPLRLSDDRTAERAPAARARVREGVVTLDFRVPAHRFFPEREEPWVLARILRQASPSAEVVEAGAILKTGGFAFDSPLTWSDRPLPPQSSFVYRVEFRDALRRRRAVSDPLAVAWGEPPGAPGSLTAVGHLRSVILAWTPAAGAGAETKYRVYRREVAQTLLEQVSPEPVGGSTYVDSRVESDRDYCYLVRAVEFSDTLEIEGPASLESCARPDSGESPPADAPRPAVTP